MNLPITKCLVSTIIAFSLLLTTCVSLKKNKETQVSGAKIAFNIPVVKMDGEFRNVGDSLFFYKDKENVLYLFPYTYTDEDLKTVLFEEKRFTLFIYRQGESKGLFLDTTEVEYCQVVSVDSMLADKGFKGISLFDPGNDSLVESIVRPKGYALIEKYVSRSKPDITYPDSTIIYYTEDLQHVDFSLSEYLENKKKLKVARIRAIYNQGYKEGYSFFVPRRDLWFEIINAPVTPTSEIIPVFASMKDSLEHWRKVR